MCENYCQYFNSRMCRLWDRFFSDRSNRCNENEAKGVRGPNQKEWPLTWALRNHVAVLVQWPPVHWGRGVIHRTIHTIPSIVTRLHYLLIPHYLVSLLLPINLAFTIRHHLRHHQSLYSALNLFTIPIRYCSHQLLFLVSISFNLVSFLKGQCRNHHAVCVYVCLPFQFLTTWAICTNPGINTLRTGSDLYKSWY